MASVDGTLNITFFDTPGLTDTGQQVTLSSSAIYWDEMYWDEFYWAGAGEPVRQTVVPTEKIIARYLSVVFSYSSATEQFKLYSVAAEGQGHRHTPRPGCWGYGSHACTPRHFDRPPPC